MVMKFRVGDKVRILDIPDNQGVRGREGIITEVTRSESYPYLIKIGTLPGMRFKDSEIKLIKKRPELPKKERKNSVDKIIKEIKETKEFAKSFKNLKEIEKDVNSWSDEQIINWDN